LAIGLKLKTNTFYVTIFVIGSIFTTHTFYVTIFVIGPLLLDLSLSTHAREIAHNHSWKQNTIEIKIIHFADTSFFQIK
jgi:Sec-independent protein secretion pathway component TatC